MDQIEITGARIHNLKNIDVRIPKNKIIAITGVSGSGKSSLAFDIIFEEGLRRYMQSLGLQSGIEKEKPFGRINGLSPTIAVEQRTTRISNPRSTVGTWTKMYNLLRQFYALESERRCLICDIPVESVICPSCGIKVGNFEPYYFTFNEPSGWCMECRGMGYIEEFNEEKLIPDHTKNLLEICADGSAAFGSLKNLVVGLSESLKFDINTPYKDLPDEVKKIFLYGTEDKIQIKWKSKRFEGIFDTKFKGIIPYMKEIMEKSSSDYRRNKVEKNYMTKTTCPTCKGFRINEIARKALVSGKHIGELVKMPLSELSTFLEAIGTTRTKEGNALKNELVKLINRSKLAGISYLSLDRNMTTLSGGEAQRLSLMNHLNSDLDSLIFIVDEPSTGMHELEKMNLMSVLKEINKLGNSVIIVEHDKSIISQADEIIELGPGPGILGGYLVFQGSLDEIKKEKKSITGRYLSGELKVCKKNIGSRKAVTSDTKYIELSDVSTNNLKNVDIKIPLGMMVGIAGVSGCGKSSLISDTLVPLLNEHFTGNNGEEEEEYIQIDEIKGKLSGWNNISDSVVISQSPIGRTKTSNPVSYIGIWDAIRKIYAKEELSMKREYTEGHFSFNSEKGGCNNCKGAGSVEVQLSPTTKIDVTCEVCNGTRYKQSILDVKYKGKNINELLNLTVSEALELFKEVPNISRYLGILVEIGMGYITLGQPAPTLSGGEAQRIKLAKELGKSKKAGTLYILDEPTTGLHDSDIEKLLGLLEKLVNQGNSVIIIEHNTDVLSYADYIIELGPSGGPMGGEIIASGAPQEIKQNKNSKTGPFLY